MNFDQGISLRQLQREWEMHVQHRSGKATEKIMKFLGFSPKHKGHKQDNIDEIFHSPVRKKKKKRKVKKSRTSKSSVAPISPTAHTWDTPDPIYQNSGGHRSEKAVEQENDPVSELEAVNKPYPKQTVKKLKRNSLPTRKYEKIGVASSKDDRHHSASPLSRKHLTEQRPRTAPVQDPLPQEELLSAGHNIPFEMFCSLPPPDVYQFLCQSGFSHYADQFYRIGIWGEDLIRSDDNDLMNCGMSFKPHRKRLLSLMDCIYNNRLSNPQDVERKTGVDATNTISMTGNEKSNFINDAIESGGRSYEIDPDDIETENHRNRITGQSRDENFAISHDGSSQFRGATSDKLFQSENENRIFKTESTDQVTSWIDTIGNSVDNTDYVVGDNTVQQMMENTIMMEDQRQTNEYELVKSSVVVRNDNRAALSSPTRDELMRALREAKEEIERIRASELELLAAQLEEHRALIAMKKEQERKHQLQLENTYMTEELAHSAEKQVVDDKEGAADHLNNRTGALGSHLNAFNDEEAVDEQGVEFLNQEELARVQRENERLRREILELSKQKNVELAAEALVHRNIKIVHNIEMIARDITDRGVMAASSQIVSMVDSKVRIMQAILSEAARAQEDIFKAHLEMEKKRVAELAQVAIEKERRRAEDYARLAAEEEAILLQRELELANTRIAHAAAQERAALIKQREDQMTEEIERLAAEEKKLIQDRYNQHIILQQETEKAVRLADEVEAKKAAEETYLKAKLAETAALQNGYDKAKNELASQEELEYENDFEPPVIERSFVSLKSETSAEISSSEKLEELAGRESSASMSDIATEMAESLRKRSIELQQEADRAMAEKVAEAQRHHLEMLEKLSRERDLFRAEQEKERATREIAAAEAERGRIELLGRLKSERLQLETERKLFTETWRLEQEKAARESFETEHELEHSRLIELSKLAAERQTLHNQLESVALEAENAKVEKEKFKAMQIAEATRIETEKLKFENEKSKIEAQLIQEEVDLIRHLDEAERARQAEILRLEAEKELLRNRQKRAAAEALLAQQMAQEAELKRLHDVAKIEIERQNLQQKIIDAELSKRSSDEAVMMYQKAEVSRIIISQLEKEIFDEHSHDTELKFAIRDDASVHEWEEDANVFPQNPSHDTLHDQKHQEYQTQICEDECDTLADQAGEGDSEPLVTQNLTFQVEEEEHLQRPAQVLVLTAQVEDKVHDQSAVQAEENPVEHLELLQPFQAEKDLTDSLPSSAQEENRGHEQSVAEALLLDAQTENEEHERLLAFDLSDLAGNKDHERLGTLADKEERMWSSAQAEEEQREPLENKYSEEREQVIAQVDKEPDRLAIQEEEQDKHLAAQVNREQLAVKHSTVQIDRENLERLETERELDRIRLAALAEEGDREKLTARTLSPSAQMEGQRLDVGAEEEAHQPLTANGALNAEDVEMTSFPETEFILSSNQNIQESTKNGAVELQLASLRSGDIRDSKGPETTAKMDSPALHPGEEWLEVKGSFGGLYYHKSTKEIREPHEIFGGTNAGGSLKVSCDTASAIAIDNNIQPNISTNKNTKPAAIGDSNDSEEENASLMSVNEAIDELEQDYLQRKKEKELFAANVTKTPPISAKFLNMPPPATPPAGEHDTLTPSSQNNYPLSISGQVPLASKSPSFQEKIKLPYSQSFAEFQRRQSGASFSTEFNNEFDPTGNLYYGSFREGERSMRSNSAVGQGFSSQKLSPAQEHPLEDYSAEKYYDDSSGQNYPDYAAAYEEYGGEYVYQTSMRAQETEGYDYERDLLNSSISRRGSAITSNVRNYNVDVVYDENQEEENPYWRWDPAVGWVPKEEYALLPNQGSFRSPQPSFDRSPLSFSRKSSGAGRPSSASGSYKNKSSSKRRISNGSFGSGGGMPPLSSGEYVNNNSNMLGLAFGESGGADSNSFDDPSYSGGLGELSPRSSLKTKKTSLWG